MTSNTDYLAREAASDKQAFASLYDRFFPRVYTYMRYRCTDAAEADDLTAQVFERLLTRLDQYQPERGAFEPWLFTIVRNVFNDHIRHQKRFWTFWSVQKHESEAVAHPEDQLIEQEESERLISVVKSLDDRSRDLLGLKFTAQLSNQQIASLTGLSESNVGVVIYRAVASLRVKMQARRTESLVRGVKSQ